MTGAESRSVPPHFLAGLGGGEIAYIRKIASERVKDIFPNAPAIQPGLTLWALLGADGTPIVLTDSRDAAVANAIQNDLKTVSVH